MKILKRLSICFCIVFFFFCKRNIDNKKPWIDIGLRIETNKKHENALNKLENIKSGFSFIFFYTLKENENKLKELSLCSHGI